MIISDLDYSEKIDEFSGIIGGRRRRRRSSSTYDLSSLFTAIYQTLSINPASSSAVNTLGGDAIGNTSISYNFTMPIIIAVNGDGNIIGLWK